jgi:hypothetical protein
VKWLLTFLKRAFVAMEVYALRYPVMIGNLFFSQKLANSVRILHAQRIVLRRPSIIKIIQRPSSSMKINVMVAGYAEKNVRMLSPK